MPLVTLPAVAGVLPSSSATLSNDFASGRMAGRADGEASAGAIWYAFGCFTGGASAIYPYLFPTDVPISPLIGKSEAYTAAYTDAFRDAARDEKAIKSCEGGCAFWTVYIILVAAAVNSANNSMNNMNN